MDSLITNDVRLEEMMPVIRECLTNGKHIWFSPKGVSMLPMIRQGIDRVLLSPLPDKLSKYDLPLYQRENGQYVLHRIVRVEKSYTCIGDNQFVLETGLKKDQMIALVTAFTRGDKKFSVNNWTYRLYCIFWHYSRPIRRIWRGGISWIRRHLK